MGRGLGSEASFVSEFVLGKSDFYVYFRLLSALFSFMVCLFWRYG